MIRRFANHARSRILTTNKSTLPVRALSAAAAAAAGPVRPLYPSPIRAASGNTKADPRETIVSLLRHIGSRKEVEQYLKFYTSVDVPKFAVIKVGGGVLENDLDTLARSLTFLAEVGLYPVVLHGAGPQLNAELKEAGIETDYINGIRITTPAILRIAKRIFTQANLRLVQALEDRGTRARPIQTGVFEATFLDKEKLGFVGKVTRVDATPVHQALESGYLPILTCLGETPEGQILNINADVAAQELAKVMRPIKIIYISESGGIRDNEGKIIPEINLETDYDHLMSQPWFKHGNRLKLKEIKSLLDELPQSSSVAITDAANLPKELFTHKGSGTLVRRAERIYVHTSLEGVNKEQLQNLIETSFDGQLVPGYWEHIQSTLHKIYISENYRAVAILRKDPLGGDVPYLDKFAVVKQSQSEGTGNMLWRRIVQENPKLFWRSRSSNPINPWYFEQSDGSVTTPQWTVFWYGIPYSEAQPYVESALRMPPTLIRFSDPAPPHPPLKVSRHAMLAAQFQKREFSTLAGNRGRRFFSTTAAAAPHATAAVGIIGGRGHTGSELIRLIGQ